jgi:hypothetical protein
LGPGLVAELHASGVEAGLAVYQVVERAVALHAGGPVVDGLDRQADVVGPWVGPGEEEHGADRGDTVEKDVVPPFDGQQRCHQDFRARLGERGHVTAPQYPAA